MPDDATDTLGGRFVKDGSTTYRIFIDLAEGSKLLSIYGDQYHPLKIQSTDTFYNNVDRPNVTFGYEYLKNWIKGNPSIALDSWLTIGLGERNNNGVLKEDDPDSTFVGGD